MGSGGFGVNFCLLPVLVSASGSRLLLLPPASGRWRRKKRRKGEGEGEWRMKWRMRRS